MSHNSGHGSQQFFERHGRYYGSFKPDKYLFPIDAEEINSMDLFHKFFLVARQSALYSRVVNEGQLKRVLDLGTGSGIWAIDIADRFGGKLEIMAVDLHRIQPQRIPLGMTTKQFDIEDPCWDSLLPHCDLVHMRMLFGSIHSALWPQVYRNIFGRLAPGSGYLEHVEIDWVPRWDERDGGGIPKPSSLEKWSNLFLEALRSAGRDTIIDRTLIRQTVENAGLIDFKEEIIRCYMGPWMADKNKQEVAKWFNLAFSRAIQAMSLTPMIDKLGMDLEQVHGLCQDAIKESLELRCHTYFLVHIWSARRPPN